MDAMKTGGRLRVATDQSERGATVLVEDDGPGIPAHHRERLFDPFFTTKEHRGSGLGLSIVDGIVSRHGGTIEVRSQEGIGTTIALSFPAAAAQPVIEVIEDADPISAPGAGPQKVLVVEDEDSIRDMMVQALKLDGHAVDGFSSGKAAVSAFAREHHTVVFTDLAMPEMSGWEVADAVRNIDSSARIILVTGWGQQVERRDCETHGVDCVLPKPFRLDDLRERVAAQATA